MDQFIHTNESDFIFIGGISIPTVNIPTPNFSIFKIQKRPAGYGLAEFTSGSIVVSLNGIEAEGFADDSADICELKATSEALERFALKYFKKINLYSETSNGWACHFTAKQAIDNAIFELIERDVSLSSWENTDLFYEIPEKLWPTEVINWRDQQTGEIEFSNLKILLNHNKNGCCVSVLLFNDKNNFVAGHASKYDLKQAIISATLECMRAAHSALRFENFDNVIKLHSSAPEIIEPGSHSLAYAYTVQMPDAVQTKRISAEELLDLWGSHQRNFEKIEYSKFKINLFKIHDRFIARVKADFLKDIYWGKSKDIIKNKYPHFVG